jgi:hypothetical protein
MERERVGEGRGGLWLRSQKERRRASARAK